MLKNNPSLEWISSKEIMERYPTFENLPDHFIGNVAKDAGNIKVKNAMSGFKILSEYYGAELKYNSSMNLSLLIPI